MSAPATAIPTQYAFDRFFYLSQDLCCIAGFDGYFKVLNDAWATALGYSIAELQAKPFIHFVHPDDVALTAAQASALAQGEDVVAFENRYRAADGSYRWLRWACRSDIREQLIYGTARDVTEEREAAARLDAFNVTLRQQADQLASSNREIESFSYSVSHDLRAPLRALDGFSQAVLESDYDRLTLEGQDSLRRVRAAARRMGLLIDDLIELSRLTRMDMRHESVDLSAIAASAVSHCRREHPDRHVIVNIASGMVVEGDPQMLRIAMDNLIDNAWKYTSRRDDARIDVYASVVDSATVFHVRDNGAGFDMKYASKLFGAFQRLHADRQFSGNGIGLATVHRVVLRHGGRIWAESTPDEGATFSFTLWSAPPTETSS